MLMFFLRASVAADHRDRTAGDRSVLDIPFSAVSMLSKAAFTASMVSPSSVI